MDWATLLVGLGTPLVAGGISYAIARSKNDLERYVAQESTAIKMVEAQNIKIAHMEDRLEAVEAELDATENKLRAALAYLDLLGMWLYMGRPGPAPPLPEILKRSLANSRLWERINWGDTPGDKEEDNDE